MPEFRLRYKLPPDLTTDWEIEEFLDRVTTMAEDIQLLTERVFDLPVVWEIREFGRSRGMPTFDVTGWVTDNEDLKIELTLKAQDNILKRMLKLARKDETVSCWFQRVKGKWGEAKGIMD